MDIRHPLIILLGKTIIFFSRLLNIGNGGTWPGEIALRVDPEILYKFWGKLRKGIILIAGTNGKTTTSLLIKQILIQNKSRVIHNDSGANLVNGIVSALIQNSSISGNITADWGVFEVDENSLPLVLKELKNYSSSDPPAGGESRSSFGNSSRLRSNNKSLIIVLLNLFRDQLDRYGEVDVIAEKWEKAIKTLDENTTLILNADDPQISYLGHKAKIKTMYFGLDDVKSTKSEMEHATDSIYCLKCREKLNYKNIYYSHIGNWYCTKCKLKRPKLNLSHYEYPLPGIYNRYNILASVLVARTLGINEKDIKKSVSDFKPAFGRQEEMEIEGKKIKIFLSKNPAGFNESIRTVISLGAKQILFVLNDRIPDGKDVSWIWDVDFEMIPHNVSIIVSGERVYDLALRIKYSIKQLNNGTMEQLKIFWNLRDAINIGLKKLNKNEILYILPTYSAMLDVRKILKGREIL